MFSKGSLSIDIKETVDNLDDAKVLLKYFSIKPDELPIKINSPFRKDDNPSLSIYYTPEHKIRFKDFGTGEGGSIIDLLGKIWGTSFKDTVLKVYQDFDGSIKVSQTKLKTMSRNKLSNVIIKVKTRAWKDWDIAYWETYGISLPWLKFGDIQPISKIFYIKGTATTTIDADKYAYCYIEGKDNKVSLKIYQPFSEKYKWSSKHDSSVWDLWAKLPKTGDILIITSSRKDALAIWENTGIPSTSMQGEGYLPKPQIIEELKSRFKNIYVLYDNDFNGECNWGRIDGKKIADMYNLKQIEIPEEFQSKDPSDLVKNYSREKLREVIKNLIISNNDSKQ